MSKYLVIPQIVGGLGNRLFILSAAFGLASEQGKEIVLSDSLICATHHNGDIQAYNYFFRNIKRVDNERIKNATTIREPPYSSGNYVPLPNHANDVILDGYFQSEKYFKHVRSYILEQYGCPIDVRNILEKKYNFANSVFLHVRRGDYLVCNPLDISGYYKRAVKRFPDNITWYIFSDDIQYCIDNPDSIPIDREKNTVIYVHEDEIISLWMMSLCEGAVCANSTFSWWGAYLQREDEISKMLSK